MFGFGSDLASGRTKRESTSPLSLCYLCISASTIATANYSRKL